MKKIIGLLIMLIGVITGIWLGLYVMLYGGIMQIIANINPICASGLTMGIIRTIFFEIGVIPAYFGLVVGYTVMNM